MDWMCRPEFWTTFITLACLEIVLGIDNIVFHSLTVSSLSAEHQKKTAVLGLSLAMLLRFGLLFSLVGFMSLTKIFLVVLGNEISARDVVLLIGGGFLVIKSLLELSQPAERDKNRRTKPKQISVKSCIIQIVILDLVFSIDSVITAVGMANDLRVIMMAILFSIGVMMLFSGAVSNFMKKHSRVRHMAFAFIALVGSFLIAEGLGVSLPKAYIYIVSGLVVALELIRSKICPAQDQKQSTRRRVGQHRHDFSQSVHAPVAPLNPPQQAPLSMACSQCRFENRGYWFCVQCGEGLGTVSLALGEVAY